MSDDQVETIFYMVLWICFFAIFNAIVILGLIVPVSLILTNLAKEDKKDKED